MTFRLPRPDEHIAIVGRNGSGKTQLGAWLLSKQNFKARPYVIVDYKGDELLNAIDRAREIGTNEWPRQPGLYILHSRPDLETDTEAWLHGIWERENIGLYFDEGYMIPKLKAFRNLLTQGRSKTIPIITLSQRPIEIDRFVFSEASHVVVFHLNDDRDIKTVREFTPKGFTEWLPPEMKDAGRLPPYHSRWYNIKDDEPFLLKPVPPADEILSEFERKLERKLRMI